MPFYVRKCTKCEKVFTAGDKCDLCAQCDPIKVRGNCTRCEKQIPMSEDYAHSSDSSPFGYVCRECWLKHPHYITK